MSEIHIATLQGTSLIDGKTEGYAMCLPDSIAGWSGMDDCGVIIEKDSVHKGDSVEGRILVMPGGKGSIGWSCHFTALKANGHAPRGWVFRHVDARVGVALVTTNIPAVCVPAPDPFSVIRDNDKLKIDGEKGVVEVWREQE
ncbi:MAG: DUF126 domain-containing protein [bacterium]|nr:DUF126 domain-containing protein [bacterium]